MNGQYIERPGLPRGKVTSVIIGTEYARYIHAIESLGIDTVKVPANPDISPNIACHADMSVFHCGRNEFFITASSQLTECIYMHYNGLILHIAEKCGMKYPDDVKTNACIIGSKIFCSKTGTSKEIIRYAEERGYEPVFVNQGYVKCSVCILDENHIITDDRSIETAAEKNGINVFRYDGNDVILKGYDRGFIGGTCGKISDSEIVFTGRFKTDEIERYAESSGINVKYLSDDAPYDVGSIIPVTETTD
jgi:hypothetical protein